MASFSGDIYQVRPARSLEGLFVPLRNDMLSALRSCEFQAAEQLNQPADSPDEKRNEKKNKKKLKSLGGERCFAEKKKV